MRTTRFGAALISFISAGTTLSLQANAPSARNSHVMATDAHGGVVMFGGAGSSAPRLADTLWRWNGDAWQPLPGDGPRSRNMSAVAFDTRRNVLVLYGGTGVGSGTRFGDTWEWDGQRWHERNVRTPGPRDHHAMAFDQARGNVVAYGGAGANGFASGTWAWDGTEWKLADSSSGPGPLVHHAMAYDARRGRVVMFGGINPGTNQRQSDTWEWDGRQWTRQAVTGGPGPRSHHRMAFDAHNGVTVLFGGGDTTATATWTYDGTAWQRHDVAGPESRWSSAMAYDATRQRVVLFGGGQTARPYRALGDTWLWDGARWTPQQR